MQYWWLVAKYRAGSSTHTANTHLLRDFVSCVICRTDAGACQAISCLRWFSLSPLWREQLGPSGVCETERKCVNKSIKNVLPHICVLMLVSVHMCMAVCVVRQRATFPAAIMLPERGKGKEHYLKMPSSDIPLPYHSLRSTKLKDSSRRKMKLLHILLQNQPFFSNVVFVPDHKM